MKIILVDSTESPLASIWGRHVNTSMVYKRGWCYLELQFLSSCWFLLMPAQLWFSSAITLIKIGLCSNKIGRLFRLVKQKGLFSAQRSTQATTNQTTCLYSSKRVGRRGRNQGSKAIRIIIKFPFFPAREFNWHGLDYKTYEE